MIACPLVRSIFYAPFQTFYSLSKSLCFSFSHLCFFFLVSSRQHIHNIHTYWQRLIAHVCALFVFRSIRFLMSKIKRIFGMQLHRFEFVLTLSVQLSIYLIFLSICFSLALTLAFISSLCCSLSFCSRFFPLNQINCLCYCSFQTNIKF